VRRRPATAGIFARSVADEIVIEHPNRQKASSKVVKLIVVVSLLASAVLATAVTVGGWDALAGVQILQIAYIAL